MAEPDAIFKHCGYMNVNEGKMYIGVYNNQAINISNITAQCDVVFEIL